MADIVPFVKSVTSGKTKYAASGDSLVDASGNKLVPDGEQLVASVGSIDATATGTTNLYTVPAGKSIVITKAIVRVSAIDTLTVNPKMGIGIAAGEDDMISPVTVVGLTSTNDKYQMAANARGVVGAASDVIKLGIDTAATATTLTLTVDLFGYFVGGGGGVGGGNSVIGWTSFTPTGTWTTNVTYEGWYRQSVDMLDVNMKIDVSGAVTAAQLAIDMPSGFTIDTSKLFTGTGGDFIPLGMAVFHDAGTNIYHGRVMWNSTVSAGNDRVCVTELSTGTPIVGNPTNAAHYVSNSNPFTWANGDQLFARFSIPVNESI